MARQMKPRVAVFALLAVRRDGSGGLRRWFFGRDHPSGVSLTITPSPSNGYTSGEKISISVAANHYFVPFSSIKVIQCADPGGKTSVLPKSVLTCDGNTVQANTIIPARDGSFTERNYVV